jgi:predicted dehydrogenase
MQETREAAAPLEVAIVGLGWWGRTILDLLGSSRKLRPAMLVEPNPGSAQDVAGRTGLPLASSLEEALAAREVRAVVLCTPHSQHCAQIVAAANAGKHVFCEKPLSMSRAEVIRAIDAVNANGVALAVGHERRFEPPIIEALRLVKSGELGTPLQVEANFSQDKFLSLPAGNWRLSASEAPAGPMTATGIHLLDLAIGVFGEAESVHASVRRLGSEIPNGDTLALLVSFRSGGHALISAILATPFVGRFAVYCSRGWVEVRDRSHPEAPEGWILTQCLRDGRPGVREFDPAPAVLANLEAFADAAAGLAPYPVPQREMIANIAALEAVFRSARSGSIEPVEN